MRVNKNTVVSLIRSDKRMRPSDVLCQVFSMVDDLGNWVRDIRGHSET